MSSYNAFYAKPPISEKKYVGHRIKIINKQFKNLVSLVSSELKNHSFWLYISVFLIILSQVCTKTLVYIRLL